MRPLLTFYAPTFLAFAAIAALASQRERKRAQGHESGAEVS